MELAGCAKLAGPITFVKGADGRAWPQGQPLLVPLHGVLWRVVEPAPPPKLAVACGDAVVRITGMKAGHARCGGRT